MRVAPTSFPELGQLRTAIVHAHAQGRLQEAVALNCIALLLSPQDGTTHTNAGAFYYEVQRNVRIGCCLGPEYALGLYNYGTALLKRRAWHDVVSLFWQRLGFRNHVAQVPSMLGIQALVHVLLLDTMPTPVADCTQRLLCEKYGVHFAPNSTLGALADATAACERSMNVTAIAVGHTLGDVLDHVRRSSRWEREASNSVLLYPRVDSQDAWVFRAPISAVDMAVPLGYPRSDSHAAHRLRQLGYDVVNWGRYVRAMHVHASSSRSYAEADTIRGADAYVRLAPSLPSNSKQQQR
ncbi:hypothetical protein SDRG_14932 [Saprolegnia diclina VS20]|uniref:Uncharacterized protein n=1 Tax=Saprolegnia diclina (strain VS20) TaxID=1156394 RepID=T0PYJ6_SAPDV|nr:hypothetical protein SDRG_14932 [Saprolegnia diclina VS20]EQC27311.1 hypothetical protein SDRG_14932 [Saprolegnia diclina VS20]|eukprot:XP_008619314.1 hypothetical protein SDRG_14932 [Saprolegnia diclina VS20]